MSSLGQVRSLDRTIYTVRGPRRLKGKNLEVWLHRSYLRTSRLP